VLPLSGRTSETLGYFNNPARHNIPEGCHLNVMFFKFIILNDVLERMWQVVMAPLIGVEKLCNFSSIQYCKITKVNNKFWEELIRLLYLHRVVYLKRLNII
jgi:hypothetical protein